MNTPLKLINVSKTFKDGDMSTTILDQLSLTVESGEFIAIVGPSGSGKSTVLSIAGALQSADEGEILINGHDISTFNDREKSDVRLNSIGYIFQASNLIPFLNVRDQLKLVTELDGAWNATTKKRATELLQAVGLSKKERQAVHMLSGGERQRVAIARAFMNMPDLIFADEPTAALDAARSQEIVSLISNEVHRKNKAAVMVTHDETVLHFCDKVYEMDNGKLSLRSSKKD